MGTTSTRRAFVFLATGAVIAVVVPGRTVKLTDPGASAVREFGCWT